MKKLSHVRDLAFIQGTFVLNFMKLSVNVTEAKKLTDSKPFEIFTTKPSYTRSVVFMKTSNTTNNNCLVYLLYVDQLYFQ